MYNVTPLGINTKDNDRNVKDGFLQESINLQRRDGTLSPLPERLYSGVDTVGYTNIILHKVGDENKINVLGFKISEGEPTYLAFDLAGWLGGTIGIAGELEWYGTITDGIYTGQVPVGLDIQKTPGLSFTILNGLIYFMGDGSNDDERFYYRLQFDESKNEYILKDMYAWKSLVHFYPIQEMVELTFPAKANNVFTSCGIILIRTALVLKSGETVLHSPIYAFTLCGVNLSDTEIKEGDTISNIHTVINLNFDFQDQNLFIDEVSTINIYASLPKYETKFPTNVTAGTRLFTLYKDKNAKPDVEVMAEQPFYLVKTIDKSSTDKLLLSVGPIDTGMEYDGEYSIADISTIAAGEIMPVDNYSYHHVFGRISSYNGRLVVDKPKTVLSGGHLRALATENNASQQGFVIITEDGKIEGYTYGIDKNIAMTYNTTPFIEYWSYPRGLLSYPDSRASSVGANKVLGNSLRKYNCRANTAHNMACAFNMLKVDTAYLTAPVETGGVLTVSSEYNATFEYGFFDGTHQANTPEKVYYSSDNRVQFSAVGEFSVWPAINSYRIGEGKIMNVGANSVDVSNTDIAAPLIVGTTDGVYTMNIDPTGNGFITSVTKTANTPYLSKETLQIGNILLFVSDKGLMGLQNGEIHNFTKDHFSDQGNGGFPDNETVFTYYGNLVSDYFGSTENPYLLGDIITYLKGAIIAFDGRRDTIWCCNIDKGFSLIYSVTDNVWGISTTIFDEKPELFSIIETEEEGEVYSRYLLKSPGENELLILSGEDMSKEVTYHLLTRPIKTDNPDNYKKIRRMFSRCELHRTQTGMFSFGVWGKQDLNNRKMNIPVSIIKGSTSLHFPNNVRQDIPIGWRKGKFKAFTILQGGKALPNSSLDGFEFDLLKVDDSRMR